jgi:hypothetical protein
MLPRVRTTDCAPCPKYLLLKWFLLGTPRCAAFGAPCGGGFFIHGFEKWVYGLPFTYENLKNGAIVIGGRDHKLATIH